MGFQFRKLTCLQIKIQRKMHTNLNKCQVESCPALPGRYLISTCKRRVESVPAGRVKVSFRQTRTMQSPAKFAINVTTLLLFTDTFINWKDPSLNFSSSFVLTIKWRLFPLVFIWLSANHLTLRSLYHAKRVKIPTYLRISICRKR